MADTRSERILNQYAELMRAIDAKCAEVFAGAPEIPCKNKCVECCKQLFPITFVEAFHISEGLKSLDRPLRRELKKNAEKITEKIHLQNPFRIEKHGVDRTAALNTHAQFAEFLHDLEADCPALQEKNPDGACAIYPFRNHDCRVMGCSFDASANAIVGCGRFDSLKYLMPKLMPFNYRYQEKMRLDCELIAEKTDGMFTQNIIYLTTVCTPLTKDYASEDWIKFFAEKATAAQTEPEKYCVVIDA